MQHTQTDRGESRPDEKHTRRRAPLAFWRKITCVIALAAALTLCAPTAARGENAVNIAAEGLRVITGIDAPAGICADAYGAPVVSGAGAALYGIGDTGAYALPVAYAYNDVNTVGALSAPAALAVGADGTLYIADAGNHAVRAMPEGGALYTLAGNGTAGFVEGTRGGAAFSGPSGIAVGVDGTVYVADTQNHCIRTMDAYGYTRLYAGAPGQRGFEDGALKNARFFEPCGLSFGEDGSLYVADSANHAVRKIKDGVVTTLAGGPGAPFWRGYTQGGHVDGADARFNYPSAVATYGGMVFVADTGNHSIRLITESGVVTALGNGQEGGAHTYKNGVTLGAPRGVAVSGDTLYVSDTGNDTVLAVTIDAALLRGRLTREAIGVRIGPHYAAEDGLRVFANGAPVRRSAPRPFTAGDGVMIPARAVCRALGIAYTWDAKARVATMEHNGRVLTFGRGQYIIKDAVAYVPLDAFAAAYNCVAEVLPDKNVLWLETLR